jgi:hypothetical protein
MFGTNLVFVVDYTMPYEGSFPSVRQPTHCPVVGCAAILELTHIVLPSDEAVAIDFASSIEERVIHFELCLVSDQPFFEETYNDFYFLIVVLSIYNMSYVEVGKDLVEMFHDESVVVVHLKFNDLVFHLIELAEFGALS